jgi:hypothetical protein
LNVQLCCNTTLPFIVFYPIVFCKWVCSSIFSMYLSVLLFILILINPRKMYSQDYNYTLRYSYGHYMVFIVSVTIFSVLQFLYVAFKNNSTWMFSSATTQHCPLLCFTRLCFVSEYVQVYLVCTYLSCYIVFENNIYSLYSEGTYIRWRCYTV